MKTIRRHALFLMFLLTLISLSAFAADSPTPPDSKAALAGLITAATPFVIPFVVWAFKAGIGKLPSFSLPILATLLGIASTYVNQVIAGGHFDLIGGAALGLLAVGIREVIDQGKKVVGFRQELP